MLFLNNKIFSLRALRVGAKRRSRYRGPAVPRLIPEDSAADVTRVGPEERTGVCSACCSEAEIPLIGAP